MSSLLAYVKWGPSFLMPSVFYSCLYRVGSSLAYVKWNMLCEFQYVFNALLLSKHHLINPMSSFAFEVIHLLLLFALYLRYY